MILYGPFAICEKYQVVYLCLVTLCQRRNYGQTGKIDMILAQTYIVQSCFFLTYKYPSCPDLGMVISPFLGFDVPFFQESLIPNDGGMTIPSLFERGTLGTGTRNPYVCYLPAMLM